jgi:hypothetical protein
LEITDQLALVYQKGMKQGYFENKSSKSGPLRGIASQQVGPDIQFSRKL